MDAVQCALEVQGATAAAKGPLVFRVAINLGDVIADDGDIFGDGVNIAARLEELAEPGGIALSGSVWDNAAVRELARFTDASEHALKNIWRWHPSSSKRWHAKHRRIVS